MIYFVKEVGDGARHVKIGYTGAEEPESRLTHIQTGNPNKLEVWYTMPGELKEEGRLHQLFSSSRVSGEWFLITPEISLFLILPLQDQIRFSKTEIARNLYEAAFEVYLFFDKNGDAMFRRKMIFDYFMAPQLHPLESEQLKELNLLMNETHKSLRNHSFFSKNDDLAEAFLKEERPS